MLLINVIMVKFAERDLIRARISSGRLLIRALEQNLGQQINHKKTELAKIRLDPLIRGGITGLLTEGDFAGATIVDRKGNLFFTEGTLAEAGDHYTSITRDAMETGIGTVNFSGSTWGVIWLGQEEVDEQGDEHRGQDGL